MSLIFNLHEAHAAQFNQSYIRTDRQKANTPTTGLVCAEPASAGVEGSVHVTFPAGYSLSSNTTNWTVATTDLPDGASAWPGIGTAISISSNTVTFPSSDLTPGTLYCFTWTKQQALTTSSTGIQYGANITTKTLGSVTIDSTNLTLNAIPNDQLTVNATVEPLSRSAELNIEGVPGQNNILTQDQVITVILKYRHALPESYPMEITAEWDQGLIDGTNASFIDLLTYEVGSATATDDGTKPTIDVVKRRITWSIPPFGPSQIPHELSFKLKVRSDIPTDSKLTAKIKTYARFVNSTLPERSINYTIKKSSITPTPSPAPRTTISQSIPLKFNYIEVNEISNSYFITSFQTNRSTVFTILYGDNSASLKQKITGLNFQNLHKVKVPDLLPQTQYYFRIIAKDRTGKEISSDLFTVTTASEKDTVKLNKDDFTVFWRKYFLLSQSADTVVIPKNKSITVTARIGESSNFYRIKALFKNENVLGINNIDPSANIEETPLVEILPGISSGEIQTPSTKGIYTIDFRLTDIRGGIYTKSAPYKFYVSDPLIVLDKKTKKPIENATVKILKYEDGLKQFTPLSNSFAIQSKTNEKGELDIVLPTGIYTIEVKSARHKSAEKRIELGISSLNYPVFELEQDNSVIALLRYYREEMSKFWNIASLTISDFFSSPNNKDLFLIFSLLFLLFLILLNLHLRKKSGMVDRVLSFSILDILEFLTVLCGLLFIKFLGIGETRDLAISTLVIFALGVLYIRRAFFRKKK